MRYSPEEATAFGAQHAATHSNSRQSVPHSALPLRAPAPFLAAPERRCSPAKLLKTRASSAGASKSRRSGASWLVFSSTAVNNRLSGASGGGTREDGGIYEVKTKRSVGTGWTSYVEFAAKTPPPRRVCCAWCLLPRGVPAAPTNEVLRLESSVDCSASIAVYLPLEHRTGGRYCRSCGLGAASTGRLYACKTCSQPVGTAAPLRRTISGCAGAVTTAHGKRRSATATCPAGGSVCVKRSFGNTSGVRGDDCRSTL